MAQASRSTDRRGLTAAANQPLALAASRAGFRVQHGGCPAYAAVMQPDGMHSPLRRDLSCLAIGVLAVNGIIGAGIFGRPDDAARLTGAFSPFVFVICGALMCALMMSMAQAASYFRGTGGPVLYAEVAFGRFAGFQVGWVYLVGRVLAVAANNNLLTTYAGALVFEDADHPEWFRIVSLVALTIAFSWVNIAGVRTGMRAVFAVTIAKFVPLLVFVLVGLACFEVGAFQGMELPTREDMGAAVLLVFYAFIGFENALVPAGEFKDPQRDIPRAMLLTCIFATALYAVIQAVAWSVRPDIAHSEKPLADAAQTMMGDFGGLMISVGAIISVLGNYASTVLSTPRIAFAMANEGMLPAWFASVHKVHATPHVAIAAFCGTGLALGIAGTFRELAVMSSLARLVVYAVCVLSVPLLHRRLGGSPGCIRLPGGWAVHGIALLTCVWLMAQVTFDAVWKTGALVAVGSLLFLVAKAGRSGTRRAGGSP